jgi:hypothetical protein
MIQSFTIHLAEDEVPEAVRREALRRGVPLDELVKEALLKLARRINGTAKERLREKMEARAEA